MHDPRDESKRANVVWARLVGCEEEEEAEEEEKEEEEEGGGGVKLSKELQAHAIKLRVQFDSASLVQAP